MKTFYRIMILPLLFMTACANTHIPKARITFKVTNQDGVPIVNEPTRVGFYPKDTVYGKTDKNGYFTAEGRTLSDYLFAIGRLKVDEDSPKYYATYFRKDIADWKNYPTDGKWKPWNETIEVVVKEKLNPIPMYAINFFDFKSNIPSLDKWVGYDLEKNDWIKPYGNGLMADFEYYLSLTFCKGQFLKQSLKIRFPHSGAGYYLMKKDLGHALSSTYHADVNQNYQSEITFTKTYLFSHENFSFSSNDSFLLGKEDYMVFRTRTKVDNNGNLIEAQYGKIYGPIDFNFLLKPTGEIISKSIHMAYHLNPNVNDTNLECNGKSLIKGIRRVAP